MPGTEKEQARIAEVIAKFPAAFALRAFPGDVFRISGGISYFTGPGECGGNLMLYTQRRTIVTPTVTRSEYDPTQEPHVEWNDFAKGTEDELRRQIEKATPIWPDGCDHTRKRDRFLGTIEAEGKPYDVFVYQDSERNGVPDMHMCWRYGIRCDQYVSAGQATPEWIARIRDTRNLPEHYVKALALTEKWLETKA